MSGWPIPQGGGGTSGTVGSTTATNTAITLQGQNFYFGLTPPGSNLLTMSTGSATQSIADSVGAGLIVPQVVFPAGAWVGNITISGTRAGVVQSEVLANPGAGGGTVKCSKAFSTLTTMANSAPSGSASIGFQASTRVAVSVAPVLAFEKVVASGENITSTITATDLTNGWIDFGGYSQVDYYDVLFTYSLNLVQAAHGHTFT